MNNILDQLGCEFFIEYDDYTYMSIWIKNAQYYEDSIWVYNAET